MSAASLERLSHEALVAHIRSRVDTSSDSFYRREVGVSAVRITAYPKRRRASTALASQPETPAASSEPTYADFLRSTRSELASA